MYSVILAAIVLLVWMFVGYYVLFHKNRPTKLDYIMCWGFMIWALIIVIFLGL